MGGWADQVKSILCIFLLLTPLVTGYSRSGCEFMLLEADIDNSYIHTISYLGRRRKMSGFEIDRGLGVKGGWVSFCGIPSARCRLRGSLHFSFSLCMKNTILPRALW